MTSNIEKDEEAMRLADALDNTLVYGLRGRAAAACIRRLVAEVAELRAASAPAVPQGDIGMVCPSAPERIWLQVDPEPEEEGKPVAPADPHQDDVTWCVDKINASDTLYIRADLSASPQVAAPAPQEMQVLSALEQRRAVGIAEAVQSLSAGYHEGAFRAGFETACEEILHRLRTEAP